jgi:hypothetical protein
MIFTMVIQEPGCLQVYNWCHGCLSGDRHLKTRIQSRSPTEDPAWDNAGKLFTNFPLVCRQIYDETCLLLYTLNTFTFRSSEAMLLWIGCRIPIQMRKVKFLKVSAYYEQAYEERSDCVFTDRFPQLEVLYVDLWRKHGEFRGLTAAELRDNLDDRVKTLLKQEKTGLKIIITGYYLRESNTHPYIGPPRDV